jgi:titin
LTDNSPDEIRFDLYRSEVGGASQVVASPAANSTTWTDTNLSPGTKYIYYLRAVNAGGSSANSNKISATTLAGNLQIPAPPTGLALSPASTSIQLTWVDNSDGEDREDGFTLERDSGSGFILLATRAPNATSHNDTGLVTGRRYQYRIRAFNSVGASAYSNVAAATTGTNTVAEPSVLVVETVSNTQLRLRWSDNSADETGFRIYRWSEAQPSFREIGTTAANATTFLDVDCTPDTKYTYYVVAVRGSAVSPGSNKASGRTLP